MKLKWGISVQMVINIILEFNIIFFILIIIIVENLSILPINEIYSLEHIKE